MVLLIILGIPFGRQMELIIDLAILYTALMGKFGLALSPIQMFKV